jgi:tetratricopeptide (TPR) repeat protein
MTDKNTYEAKAVKYYEKRNFEQAIYWFSRAIAQNPRKSDLYAERGVAYFHMGKLNDSLADLNRAQELEPERAYRYASRAYIRDAMGDIEGAIEDYRKAIELDPEDAIAHNNLGLLEEKRGHMAQAKVLFEFADKLAEDQGIKQSGERPKNIQKEIDRSRREKSLLGEMAYVFKSRQGFREFITFIRNGFKR